MSWVHILWIMAMRAAARWSRVSMQVCPAKVPSKSVQQKCPARLSSKCVKKESRASLQRVSSKECQERVSSKRVL